MAHGSSPIKPATYFEILLHQRLSFFFFNDTATTEIYTLSLHDALPIWLARVMQQRRQAQVAQQRFLQAQGPAQQQDRKSTRLNSSHLVISYAVFCLKKKKSYHGTPR